MIIRGVCQLPRDVMRTPCTPGGGSPYSSLQAPSAAQRGRVQASQALHRVWRRHRAATRWEQGYCPTCGSWPLLGEYRGLEQTRLLRCGLCASEWAIDRLVCPFCGSRNHADLGYLYVEGDEHKRAVTCENCRSYVKMLATLTPIPPIELAIHDLATIHLDMVALEQGYAAPT